MAFIPFVTLFGGCAPRADDQQLSEETKSPSTAKASNAPAVGSDPRGAASDALPRSPITDCAERVRVAHDDKTGMVIYSCLRRVFVFDHGPPGLHDLPSAPTQREPALSCGSWVIISAAEWSPSDFECILEAARFSASIGCDVRVGVRTFVDEQEITKWCPEYDLKALAHGTPQWVAIRDGLVVGTRAGYMDEKRIREFAKSTGLIRGDHDAANDEKERGE